MRTCSKRWSSPPASIGDRARLRPQRGRGRSCARCQPPDVATPFASLIVVIGTPIRRDTRRGDPASSGRPGPELRTDSVRNCSSSTCLAASTKDQRPLLRSSSVKSLRRRFSSSSISRRSVSLSVGYRRHSTSCQPNRYLGFNIRKEAGGYHLHHRTYPTPAKARAYATQYRAEHGYPRAEPMPRQRNPKASCGVSKGRYRVRPPKSRRLRSG